MSSALKHRFLRGLDKLTHVLPFPAPVNDRGERLDPFLQLLRKLRSSSQGKDAVALRADFSRDMKAMRHGYAIGKVSDFTVAGRPVRLYQPTSENRLPVVAVYFHGGGFVMGDLESHDDACRLLAETSGIALLAVDYRLAPEHPFPAAVEDAQAVVRWASENLEALEATHLAVAGDSAGGNLAAVVARRVNQDAEANQPHNLDAQPHIPLLCQLLMYPGTDLLAELPSQSAFGQGYFLNRADRDAFYSAYLPGDLYSSYAADERVSPLRYPVRRSTNDEVPAIVVTAGFDMLRDEGMAYARQMQAASSQSRHLHFGSLGHAFINLAGVSRACEQALIDIALEWRALALSNL